MLLVNARQVKHVPGRKTDVLDCQWLQALHSVGHRTHTLRRWRQRAARLGFVLVDRDPGEALSGAVS